MNAPLVNLVQAAARHLSERERIFIAFAFHRHSARVAVLLSAYAGQEFPEPEWARLMLEVAKRVVAEGPVGPS